MGLIMRNRKCYTGKVRETNPLEWKLLGTATGATSINLPADYYEIYIEVSGSSLMFTGYVIKETSGGDILVNGYYMTNPYGAAINVTKTATTINLKQVYVSGNDITAQCTLKVYYR